MACARVGSEVDSCGEAELRLDEGFRLRGGLQGPGSARIAGEVLGPVRLEGSLRVEPHGVVRGAVWAARLHVASAALVEGEIRATMVRVAPGGRLRGQVWIEAKGGAG